LVKVVAKRFFIR